MIFVSLSCLPWVACLAESHFPPDSQPFLCSKVLEQSLIMPNLPKWSCFLDTENKLPSIVFSVLRVLVVFCFDYLTFSYLIPLLSYIANNFLSQNSLYEVLKGDLFSD